MLDDSATALAAGNVADAALSGLLQPRKTLPAKLFYDEEGCRLFGEITRLPEYYLTRTERALLERVAPAVAATVKPPAVLVEYGASDEAKAEFLLRTGVFGAYVPIDVAVSQLEQMRARLRQARPGLLVYLVPADFTEIAALPIEVPTLPRLGFFPGSTIGNLDADEAQSFLQRARGVLGEDATFLVGVDLRKDPAILVPAYNDAQGVTAAFNRNLLVRLNREAGADFDLGAFEHRAIWNDDASRIEMHLVSRRAQTVRVAGHMVRFSEGETIHTENSYKFSLDRFAAMAGQAGWQVGEVWTDPDGLFSLHLLVQS
ncbi:MAG TPA: L-histidine N(alpha)-methyltransferase [Acetobacteraceae bacterium]|nr:L-histidine N(alpha)-methyltransferase [Acetobacteraceae bacterium]